MGDVAFRGRVARVQRACGDAGAGEVIEGYIGRPGSGKSYTLTARAIELAKRGRQVFANYPINFENCWTFTPEQLLDLPPGVIVIDEAHLWFPARMSLKLPPSWLAMLSQTRKNGWDLLWCAQHEARVDRIIRDISSWQHLCTAWLQKDGHPLLFKATAYEPEFFRRPDKAMTTRWRWFSDEVAHAYDTFERLTTAEHLNDDRDAYAASSVTERKRRAATSARAAEQRARAQGAVLLGKDGGSDG
jgi:zona occludens toxin (predicted ATPase)